MATKICKHCKDPIPKSDFEHINGWHRAMFCKKPACQVAKTQRKKRKQAEYNEQRKQDRAETMAGQPKKKVGRPRKEPVDEEEASKFTGYYCEECGAPIKMEFTKTDEPIIYRRKCPAHRQAEKQSMRSINIDGALIYNNVFETESIAAIEFLS